MHHLIVPRLDLFVCLGKLSLISLLLTACGDNSVQVYEVPKESPEAALSAAADPAAAGDTNAGGSAAAEDASAPGPEVSWTAPENWETRPLGQFRRGSYAIVTPEGAEADISVTAFPGDAGGLEANINRWRTQVGLDAIPIAEMRPERVMLDAENGELALFDLYRPEDAPPAGEGQLEAIVGGVLPALNETWFFKMTGPRAVVEAKREEFVDFLKAVQLHPTGSAAPAASAPDQPGAEGESEVPGMPAITLHPPETWRPGQLSPMRAASYMIHGPDDLAADMSVVPLPGDSGTDLENVNRWRAALKLDPIGEAELAEILETVEGELGTISMVHLVSEEDIVEGAGKGAILAALCREEDERLTWFFKMAGDAAVVQAAMPDFINFVRSAHRPGSEKAGEKPAEDRKPDDAGPSR